MQEQEKRFIQNGTIFTHEQASFLCDVVATGIDFTGILLLVLKMPSCSLACKDFHINSVPLMNSLKQAITENRRTSYNKIKIKTCAIQMFH